MESLSRGSKKWWSLNKQKKNASNMFPPIKNSAGEWCKDAATKANAFAACWTSKNVLPPIVYEMPFFYVPPQMSNMNDIRVRNTRKELSNLRLNQATFQATVLSR